VKAAELLLKCLEAEGVSHIFGLPGEENIEFLRALRGSGIRFVLTRDERGASFMANAWGRLGGSPGVCLSTLGPGAMNMLTGVADALLDFAPLLAITAQRPLGQALQETHQYVDVLSAYRPLTKWNASLRRENIPQAVRKAFRLAVAEKPGPVHLELPEDVASEEAEGLEPLRAAPSGQALPEKGALQKAAQMLASARCPVVVAGAGVLRAGANRELLSLCRRLQAPVASTFMAMGAVPHTDELFLSTIGLQERDFALCGLQRADLLVLVGYDPVEFRLPQALARKPVLFIGASPAELEYFDQAMELVGALRPTLRWLARALRPKGVQPEYLKRLKRLTIRGLATKGFPIKPLRAVQALREALGPRDILISDVGAHKLWIARFYPALAPQTVLMSNGLSSMGFALPAAVAAALLRPGRKVLAAVGDGGFMMTVAELETAVRLGLSLVVFIFNDGGYGLIRWKEQARYGESFFVDFQNPDFSALAEAFGARAFRVDSEGQLPLALREALRYRGVAVLDCPVDYSENPKLTEALGSVVCPM
jgi:acetolactate synthase-1/2/3 large subunit